MARRVDSGTNTISPSEYCKLTTELIAAQRAIGQATEALAQERGIKAGIFRRAKSAGADIEAMKHLAKLAELDIDERNRLMENVSQYAGWTGVVLWRAGNEEVPQGGLFDNDPDAPAAQQGLLDARVTGDAYNSRKGGSTVDDNPHEAGSRDHQTWAQAWKDADFELAGKPVAVKASTAPKGRAAKPAKPAPAAAPKPRGRPKKASAELH